MEEKKDGTARTTARAPSGLQRLRAVAAILLALAAGWWLGGRGAVGPGSPAGHEPASASTEGQVWTCAMHPQIRLPKPGKCPICFMDLVPVSGGTAGDLGPRTLRIRPEMAELLRLETRPAVRKAVEVEVRISGKLAYDETRLSYITAWVPGRLDRLYVDYTGVQVHPGDHLVQLYSPELYSSQEELLQALEGVRALESGGRDSIASTRLATLDAVRERLRQWGLTEAQVKEIEERGTPSEHTTVYAPQGGVVVEKHANQGMYVERGTRIYTIADLSHLWVELDAYESDLTWLRYGQSVEVDVPAYPGDTFHGTIAFVSPVLDPRTRTVKVRVNVENHEGRLKPGMFVHARVQASVSSGGKVMAPDLEGRWICPMHPEVVADEPGACDLCGMDLVSTESLGYVSVAEGQEALVIPATAPLLTGTRAVVFVELPGAEEPTYRARDVVLGPRAGDEYVVLSGLEEGELVVVEGAFKLDSELQIRGEESLMSPRVEAPRKGPVAQALVDLSGVWEAYASAGAALAEDDAEDARGHAAGLVRALEALELDDPPPAWAPPSERLGTAARALMASADLEAARRAFESLSLELEDAVVAFGAPTGLLVVVCPMAFDGEGAHWLQASEPLANPYFGTAMPACGTVQDQIPAARPR